MSIQTPDHINKPLKRLWGHIKDFLPTQGMKPQDVSSYLGWFMWDRNWREMKKDKFIHFLRCAGEICPPTYKSELQIQPDVMSTITKKKLAMISDDDFCP